MRVLHTADWHLGQTLHDVDRHFEQEAFLCWLADVLLQEKVDVLLVCGDIFDSANPSAHAQALLYHFLALVARQCPHLQVILVAGNHDSAARLEAPAPLLAGLSVRVVGALPPFPWTPAQAAHFIIPLRSASGRTAYCVALPFLRPNDLPTPDAAGVAAVYQQAVAFANLQRQPGDLLWLTGHLYLSGCAVSELSERRIFLGGAQAVACQDLPVADYIALGHLHRAQTVGGQAHIRYSGAPLPLAFGECNYAHQVVLVSWDEQGRTVTPVNVPLPVAWQRIGVPVAQNLSDTLKQLAALPLATESTAATFPYLEVQVRLQEPVPDLRAQIQAALQNKAVRLVKITPVYAALSVEISPICEALPTLNTLRPEEVLARCWAQQFPGEVPVNLREDFQTLWAQVMLEQEDKV